MTAATFEASLFEHLSTLLSGNSTVRDFRHWFNSASWESGGDLPDALYELASDIEHLGYIRDSGVWDDATYLRNVQVEVAAYCDGPADHASATRSFTASSVQCFKARVA